MSDDITDAIADAAFERAWRTEAEVKRLREAGDALADAVSDIMGDDPESVLHTWVAHWRVASASPALPPDEEDR